MATAVEKSIIISAEVQKEGFIAHNFDAIKSAVEDKIKPYMGLIFQDEDIRDAKGTLADLRKMRTSIEDKRKAIKKQWNQPYDEFEAKVKEIVAVIDKPIAEIDDQVKDYQARKKEEKKTECEGIIEGILASIDDDNDREFVTACGVTFDERWLNATTAISQVEKDVFDQVKKILGDASSIADVCEGDEMLTDLLVDYKRSKDLSAVLRRRKDILEARAAAKKRKEEQEAKKAAEAERKAQELNETSTSTEDTPVPENVSQGPDEAPVEQEAPSRLNLAFSLEGTSGDLADIMAIIRSKTDVRVTRLYGHVDAEGSSFWTAKKEN